MVIWAILGGVVGILIGVAIGYAYRKNIAEKKIGRAEETVVKLIEDAQKKAEALYCDKKLWNRMSLMNIAGAGIPS